MINLEMSESTQHVGTEFQAQEEHAQSPRCCSRIDDSFIAFSWRQFASKTMRGNHVPGWVKISAQG